MNQKRFGATLRSEELSSEADSSEGPHRRRALVLRTGLLLLDGEPARHFPIEKTHLKLAWNVEVPDSKQYATAIF